MDAPAKVRPTHLSAISRDDIRNTLHTHFHAQAAKRHAAAAGARVPSDSTSANSSSNSAHSSHGGSASGRKRVFSFVQVQKKKVSLTSKRIFGHGGLGSGASSKYYILCVTVQDVATSTHSQSPQQQQQQQCQLHYVQLLSTFQVEVRQSWDIRRLDVIENNGLTSEKKRGSFALCFEGEDAPWQWLVADSESKFAMHEFLWSLCALSVDKKKVMPRLVRMDAEELSDIAIRLGLQKKYSVDVDLLDYMASVKKTPVESDDGANSSSNNNSKSDAPGDSSSSSKSGAVSASAMSARLTAAENDDAAALLADIDWGTAQLLSIEDDLKKQLRTLEDENITFLLSFEGSDGAASSSKSKSTSSSSSSAAPSGSSSTSVDRILAAIDTVLARVALVQAWTTESDDVLAQTSQDMLHFESHNNQLEVHFKNSVALQETLARMIALVEIPREHMGVLLKPPSLFPDDALLSTAAPGAADRSDLGAKLSLTLATITRVDAAIKSTIVFPASEMAAFRARGDELTKLARAFCDKLCAAFDDFLQRRARQWLVSSRAASSAALLAGGGHSPTKARGSTTFGARDLRELSASMRSAIELSRGGGRALTSFESSAEVREMDWSFSNELFHSDVVEYQPLVAHIQSLDPRMVSTLRQVYAKNLASVYNPHVLSLFRCLKEKLPRASKPHFAKPQALQSWSFHLSSSHLGDALGASPLLQQALDHVVPLVIREQRFVSLLFFPDHRDDAGEREPEDLALLMESVFEKLLKRLSDFGEAAAARNILDALALVVLVHSQLERLRAQSEFLFNVLVSFELQMKRILVKFTDDQEAWINNHNNDTRMAGVLSPIQKTLAMVSRLEESVCGKTDDSTLASIYHRILPATIRWLERISDTKPKYRDLTRLENFLFMSEKLQAINVTADLPLAQYAASARAKYLEHLALYVAYIWEYEFKQLVPLFRTIEELLKTVPAQEIQYHAPRADVRRVLDATSASFDKSVKAMHDRMKKHFASTAKTLPVAWKRLIEYAVDRLTLYARVALECYQLHMEPSPQRGVELLSKFTVAAP